MSQAVRFPGGYPAEERVYVLRALALQARINCTHVLCTCIYPHTMHADTMMYIPSSIPKPTYARLHTQPTGNITLTYPLPKVTYLLYLTYT